jgi:hypothetical protein
MLKHGACRPTYVDTVGTVGSVNSVATVSTVDSCNYLFPWPNSPQWARASSLSRLQDHTHWHTTVGRTPLDEWSARRRDLDPTTPNTHKRQTSMPPAGYEPAIPASKRPQDLALDHAATGIGLVTFRMICRKRKVLNFLTSFDSYTPGHASKAVSQIHAS